MKCEESVTWLHAIKESRFWSWRWVYYSNGKQEKQKKNKDEAGEEHSLSALASRHVNHKGRSSRRRALMILGRFQRRCDNGYCGAGNRASCGLGWTWQSDTRMWLVTQLHLCAATFVCLSPACSRENRDWIRILAPPPPPPLSITYLAAAWRNSCCSAAGSDWPPPCRSDDHANAHRSPARAESVDTVPAGWGTPRGTSRHAMRPHHAHDDNHAAVCVSTGVANDVPDPVLSAPAVRTHY